MEPFTGTGGHAPGGNALYYCIALAVAALLLSYLQPLFSVPKDGREPPVLSSSIPIVGHLIQFIRKGSDYLVDLERQYHQSLYVLTVGKGRIYIAASPEWAQAIHKSYRSLQFNTIVLNAMKNIFLMDEPSMKLIEHNSNGEDGTRNGILLEMHDMLGSVLAPGRHLDDLNHSILNEVLPDVNKLARNGPQHIQLWWWIRHHFSIASITAIWGPKNPFMLHSDIEPLFWDFEAAMLPLSMAPLPWLFVRKGHLARKRIFDAWEEYMQNSGYDEPGVSQLVKNRVALNMEKYGFTKRMHAYGEVSMVFGAISNTVPTAFWLISYIFSDPNILAEIRQEVDACISTPTSGETKRILNATKLRTSCHLFTSALRETLRIAGGVNITRQVSEDVTVTNSAGESYLLKKDAMVQIASNVIHQRELWGSDAHEFNARRFMQNEKQQADSTSTKIPDPAAPYRDAQGKVVSAAFRSFGGGNNVCPGRHFAQTEILGLAALFVAGFEIEGVRTPGRYQMPPTEALKSSLAVIKPGRDVDVKIRRRAGFEDVEWGFKM
ncbi:uncharacterized protein LTR77_009706 [Saxophila tyrrhenica]|uniref:Cytochrome P450 n=1 Tax=Saxophila tyrrhenica TaxID=1690608 RepID=A0AAV9NXK8_9PEZI|nr:hypothetical protein LTR77_009706 [Saxophila tyrrhenica]